MSLQTSVSLKEQPHIKRVLHSGYKEQEHRIQTLSGLRSEKEAKAYAASEIL